MSLVHTFEKSQEVEWRENITTIDILVSSITYIHKKRYQTSLHYTSVLSSFKTMVENKWIYHWSYQQQTPKKVRNHSKLDYT